MLNKEVKIDKIEILHTPAGYPMIQVRKATVITDDGVEVGKSFHRHVVSPESTIDGSIVYEDKEVIDIAGVLFTGEAIDNWNAHKKAQENI